MNYSSRSSFLPTIFPEAIFPKAIALLILVAILAGCKDDAGEFRDIVVINQCDTNSLNVSAMNTAIGIDETLSFTASCTSGTGSMDLTSEVTWSVSDTTIASINKTGLLTGLADGSITVSATISDLTASANLLVTSAERTITIASNKTDPTDLTVDACNMLKLKATASYVGVVETQDVTDSVTWTVTTATGAALSDEIAQFSNDTTEKGLLLATAIPSGVNTVKVTAQKDTDLTTGTADITINDGAAVVVITPSSKILSAINDTTLFTATATFGDGSIVTDAARTVSWKSSDVTIATIGNTQGNKGIATAKAAGTANITAACNGAASAAATLTVKQTATLNGATIRYDEADTAITLNSSSDETRIYLDNLAGSTLQLEAAASFSDDTSPSITNDADATWSIDNINNLNPLPITLGDTADSDKGLITITGSNTGHVYVIVDYLYQDVHYKDAILVTVQ